MEKLTQQQIQQLSAQGCHAEDWNNISVDAAFDADSVYNCFFRGQVRIGKGVTIRNIGRHIANCAIGDGAVIENVSVIECTGKNHFGIGVQVATLNENGGRSVPLHLSISSQTAYIMALYRHRQGVLKQLNRMIEQERDAQPNDMCTVGQGAVIMSCGTLRDVNVGPYALLEGVQVLENGTVMSSKEAPSYVGQRVCARNFVFATASKVEDGALLRGCFVGQGSVIEGGFTGQNSLFFSNCILAEGEACSIFAGPYTVSHHKATLLIAGMFSFFNAGSGANQSNHLFKTGAVHQGINERGCKFASNTYVMLPARTGAYNTVFGYNANHHDSSDFPFSYVMNVEDRSMLLPAVVLSSSGMARDISKWPARDRRPAGALDLINFEEFNPYIASKVARAIDLCDELLENPDPDMYTYGRLKIKQTMLRRGRGLYRLAHDAAVGAMLSVDADVSIARHGQDDWVDISGMYAPKQLVETLLDDIENGAYPDLASIQQALKQIHDSYPSYAYGWALTRLANSDTETIVAAKEKGQKALQTLRRYTTDDALRDADLLRATGYGIDSTDPQIVAEDFAAVRGVQIKK